VFAELLAMSGQYGDEQMLEHVSDENSLVRLAELARELGSERVYEEAMALAHLYAINSHPTISRSRRSTSHQCPTSLLRVSLCILGRLSEG
jgi:hypothetical protein